MKPAATAGHDEQKSQALQKVLNQYGPPEEKQREATKKLGKDEFFKLMVTQIQHQDPLKLYQNEQMAAQMAQFTALEQMVNMNTNMEKLMQSQQPLQNLGSTNLIGKYVTVDSSRVTHTEGKQTDLKFDLPADASKVKIVVMNEKGENVREIPMEAQKKGEVKVTWDGKTATGLPAKTGMYILRISAEGDTGKSIPVQTSKTEIVHGVAFEGKETILLTGDVRSPQKIPLHAVTKIVDSAQQPTGIGAGSGFTPMQLPNVPGAPGQQPQVQAQPPTPGDNERPMPDYQPPPPGFSPFSVEGMRAAQQKKEVMPQVSQDDIRHAMESANDLTDANPAAAAVRAGKPLPGKTMPSGVEGSTAGKWAE